MNASLTAIPTLHQGRWQIVQTYMKNVRLTARALMADQISGWNPQISLQANPRYQLLSENRYEVILALQIQCQQAGKPLAEIYVEQAGLFVLTDLSPEQQQAVLYGIGCNALYGFIGVHVNYLLAQAELPPVYLAPLDFVSLYQRFRQQQAGHTQPQVPFAVFFDPNSGQLKE